MNGMRSMHVRRGLNIYELNFEVYWLYKYAIRSHSIRRWRVLFFLFFVFLCVVSISLFDSMCESVWSHDIFRNFSQFSISSLMNHQFKRPPNQFNNVAKRSLVLSVRRTITASNRSWFQISKFIVALIDLLYNVTEVQPDEIEFVWSSLFFLIL